VFKVRLEQDKQVIVRGKVVGTIRRDRVYVSHRNKNHYFKIFNGFGVSASVLDELRKYDVKKVIVIYTKVDGSQELWIANTNDFYEYGKIYKDVGNDYQRILNQEYWRK